MVPARIHVPEAVTNRWAVFRKRLVHVQRHTEVNKLSIPIDRRANRRVSRGSQVALQRQKYGLIERILTRQPERSPAGESRLSLLQQAECIDVLSRQQRVP